MKIWNVERMVDPTIFGNINQKRFMWIIMLLYSIVENLDCRMLDSWFHNFWKYESVKRDSCESSQSSREICYWELRIENWYLLYSMKIWIVKIEHWMVDFIIFRKWKNFRNLWGEILVNCHILHGKLRIEYWYLLYSMKIWNVEHWMVDPTIFGNMNQWRDSCESSCCYIQLLKIWIVECWIVDFTIFGNTNQWREIRVSRHNLHGKFVIENWELRIGIFYIQWKFENWELSIFYIQWKFGS